MFWSALRRWGERALAAGVVAISDIRSGDPASCTLPRAVISPPPVSQGRVEPVEVFDAAEIVEDKPSEAQRRAELAPPFDDSAWLWDRRLNLWHRWRRWAPEWGPRPDQDGCMAPDYLL